MSQLGTPSGPRTLTKLRWEQIARMRLGGVAPKYIADLLGVDIHTYYALINRPEYKEMEEALALGHLTKMDEALAGRTELLRQEFRIGVPAAIRALIDAVTQRRDLKACISAAVELIELDPDKTFSRARGEGEAAQDVGPVPEVMLKNLQAEADVVAASLTQKVKNVTVQ